MATPATLRYVARIDFIDHARKVSHIQFYVSSAAYTAWKADTSTGLVRDLMTAYEALSLDTVTNESVEEEAFVPGSNIAPTDENAVNSAKLLVLETDNITGEKYRNYIPARNAANFEPSTRGEVKISGTGTNAAITAFVTAFLACQLSEDGNALTVNEIRVVGRGTAA